MFDMTQAKDDIIAYLEEQEPEYFVERDRTLEEVLADKGLIDQLAAEHYKCVMHFGIEREWSAMDACDSDPGIRKENDQ